MPFDSVLFDLDGTLWDSSRTVRAAWAEAADAFRPGLSQNITLEKIHQNMGRMLPDIFDDLFPNLPQEERHALMLQCGKREMEVVARDGGVLWPALVETLTLLKERYSLFIVSNCQHGYIPAFFQAHGLESFFTGTEYAGRTGLSKGENITLVIKQYGLKRPIYVGDTQGDCNAADFAGIPFIHAAYGFGSINRTVPRLERFRALPELLNSLE